MTHSDSRTVGTAQADGGGGGSASGGGWAAGTLIGFDLETTGTDPLTARIVTAAVAHQTPDGAAMQESRQWLIDPGVPIPAAAAAVHGISTEHAHEHGALAAPAVAEIAAALESAWGRGLPIVVFNAAYDLTLLSAALRRHELRELVERPGWDEALIIDPLVIDRGVDRYRRGKRTLQAMAEHYRVAALDAHSADGDAVAACGVARAIAAAHPDVARADAVSLLSQQCEWSRAWAVNFQAYLRSQGKPDAVIDGRWPLRGA